MTTKELTKKELEQKLAELERENQELRQAKSGGKTPKSASERIEDKKNKVLNSTDLPCSLEHLRRLAHNPNISDNQIVEGTINNNGVQPKKTSGQSARRWFEETLAILKATGYTVGDY